MSTIFGLDAYAPREVAARVLEVGVGKARLPLASLLLLGTLAGAFISLGMMAFILVVSDATLGWAAQRLLGGLVFSLGLLLVLVAGAELFTGNNLIAMAWASGRIDTGDVLRNWVFACLANAFGAAGLALLLWLAGLGDLNDGAVGQVVLALARAKLELPWPQAFARGVLCNVLVCMAVWMAMAGRSVTDKAVAIVFPVTVFVAAGFEHSVANFGLFALAALFGAPLSLADVLGNLLPVIVGNIVGGSLLVALVYWVIYLRPQAAS